MNDGALERNQTDQALSRSGWLALVTLVAFLGLSVWYAIYGWNSLSDVGISTFGWIALVIGSFLTIFVGGGLMALLFYSSNHHFDR